MTADLNALLLSNLPEDGSSIGNGALLALMREYLPNLTQEEFDAAKEALVEEGVIEKGQGREGSVSLAFDSFDDEDNESEDNGDFALDYTQEPATIGLKSATRKKKSIRNSVAPVQVLSYRHKDTRVNNPEVGMVHADTDPDGEKTRWAYDPHLDPVLNFDSTRGSIEKIIDDALASGDADKMKEALIELKRMQRPYLNWTGKAEKTSVEVDTVSLHVHERVDPATILAHVAKRLNGKDASGQWRQGNLFEAPFESLPLRKAMDFYSHEKGWSNRLVAGDSLLVMNSLLTKESMAGKVQMIYLDPPYGIKYGSNFQPFTSNNKVKDRSDADLTQEPEMIKAFRDTWELGVHSYLTYLRDRLMLARELLNDQGSVLVQISDENLHHVTEVLADVFGAENYLNTIPFAKTSGVTTKFLARNVDFLIWFARDKAKAKFNQLYFEKSTEAGTADNYGWLELSNGSRRGKTKSEKLDAKVIPAGASVYKPDNIASQGNPNDPFEHQLKTYRQEWKTNAEGRRRLARSGRLHVAKDSLQYLRRLDDFACIAHTQLWTDMQTGSFTEDKIYAVQTAEKVIERCLLMTTDPGDLVLDPTCGSGTTAFVAEKWGRRWITCDTSRVAITLAKQRLMAAAFDYYTLRYPHEGLKGGFVYDTVSHIMLKNIASNADIDTIWDEDHPKIDAALADLNAILTATPPKPWKATQGVRRGKEVDFAKGHTLHEWEVPFDWPLDKDEEPIWSESAKAQFDGFHAARQAMQRRMDQSIAEHADQETRYDKPKKDANRLRITGPFSVEAVPAPTVLSLDDSLPMVEADTTVARSGETSRQSAWRAELLKTGVRGKGGNMMTFAEFETLPSCRFLHSSGSVSDTGERVVVSFGPQHAALEQRQVEEAMNEAYGLIPRPKFILFCAFTFDPEAAKDIDEMAVPGMTFLKVQMNTDLLTEDLKKNRSSNQSFWLIGQPEVDLRKRDGGLWEVEVNGFDYFNPKSGEIESGGKKQIAMWSLDTDYDQRSLFPQQVFFPMADDKGGWNRLKRTVRSELDEDLLEQFHGTVSLPFGAGEHKRIAVKIVDDRGIESLKIIPLEG